MPGNPASPSFFTFAGPLPRRMQNPKYPDSIAKNLIDHHVMRPYDNFPRSFDPARLIQRWIRHRFFRVRREVDIQLYRGTWIVPRDVSHDCVAIVKRSRRPFQLHSPPVIPARKALRFFSKIASASSCATAGRGSFMASRTCSRNHLS